MAYPDYLRNRARELRIDRRLSIDELVDRLAVPRTTVYEWVKDLPLGRARSNPGQAKGTAAMQAKYQRLREEAYAQGVAEFATLATERTFRDFVVLYIAEGYKRDRNCVAICNSDGPVMAVAHRWLVVLASKRLGYEVQFHADQDLDEIRGYWAEELGIDGSSIVARPKANSGQLRTRTWRCEYGVLTVRSSDTLLRARLQAWIDLVKGGWG